MLSVKARALRLLALREHSRAELERKLNSRMRPGLALGSRGDTDAAIDAEAAELEAQQHKAEVHRVLDELEQHGLLSDKRTADALLLAKAPRYGNRRLRQMLQAKSLAPDLVSSTLRKAHDSELDRAREAWRRRFGQPPSDLRERARQQRFLAGRGFDAPVIERVIKEARTLSGERQGEDLDDRSDSEPD